MSLVYKGFGGTASPSPISVSITDSDWSGINWLDSSGGVSQRAIQKVLSTNAIRYQESASGLTLSDANRLIEFYHSPIQVPLFNHYSLDWYPWSAAYNFDLTTVDLFGNTDLVAVGAPAYTAGISNQGVLLDGVNQYLENTTDITNIIPVSTAGNYLVSAWLDLSALTATTVYTLFSFTNASGNYKMSLRLNNNLAANGFEFTCAQSSGTSVIASEPVDFLTPSLVHIVAIADSTSGNIYIYRDGLETAIANYDGTLLSTGLTKFYIGSIDGTQQYFNGIIDSFYISRDISFASDNERQAVVNALYNSGAGRFLSLGYQKDFRLSSVKSTHVPDPSVATANQAWMSDGTSGFWGNPAVENIYWNGSNWISDTVSVASHQLQNVLKEVTISYSNRTSALTLTDKDKFISATYTPATVNTGLLLHMDTSPLVDDTITPLTLTLYNGATVSTVDKMFGPSSLLTTYNAGLPQYATAPNDTDLDWGLLSGTLELWCKANTSLVAYMTPISKYTGNMTGIEVQATLTDTKLLYGAGTANSLTHSTIIRDNLWHHIAIMKVTSTLYFFIDGVSAGVVGTVTTPIDNTDPLYIGASKVLDNTTWDGYIDEVRSIKQNVYATTGFTPATTAFLTPLEYTLSTTKATDIPDPSIGPAGYVWGTDGTNASWVAPISGGLSYLGSWDASTNTPTITPSTGTNGDYYIVNVPGTTTIDGISSWAIGDWIIFNGTTWDKIDNSPLINSINGQIGAVVLSTDDIAEGITNLYYTDARVTANTSVIVNTNHASSLPEHRLINDAGTATTDLWSASKINASIIASVVGVNNTPWAGANWTSTTSSESELQIQNALKEVGIDYADKTSSLISADNGKVVEAYYNNGYPASDLLVLHFNNSLVDATGNSILTGTPTYSTTVKKYGSHSLDCSNNTAIQVPGGGSIEWNFVSNLTSNITIRFDVYFPTFSGSGYIDVLNVNTTAQQIYMLYDGTGNFTVGCNTPGNIWNLTGPVPQNTYHTITIVKQGGALSYDLGLYIDDVLVSSALAQTGLLNLTGIPLIINRANSPSNMPFYIDELLISDQVLFGAVPSNPGDVISGYATEYNPAIVQKYQLSTAKTTDIITNTAHSSTVTGNPHVVTASQANAAPATTYGYAPLDVNGQIASSILPASVMQYQGTWDAVTNTPTPLVDGTGSPGDMYLVLSPGATRNLGSGNITFIANDYVIYNTSNIWERSPNTFSGAVDAFANNKVTYTGTQQVADYTFTGFLSATPILNSQMLFINSVLVGPANYTIIGLDLTVHFGTLGFPLDFGDDIQMEYMSNATNTWTNQTLTYTGILRTATYTWASAFTNIPHQASITLSFNGMLLTKAQYSVAGTDLILEIGGTIAYNLESGDVIDLHYEY